MKRLALLALLVLVGNAWSWTPSPCSGGTCGNAYYNVVRPYTPSTQVPQPLTWVPVIYKHLEPVCGPNGCYYREVRYTRWQQVVLTPVGDYKQMPPGPGKGEVIPAPQPEKAPQPKAVPQAKPVPAKTKPIGTGSDPSVVSFQVKWWHMGFAEGRRRIVIEGGTATVVRAGNGKSLLVTNAHVVADARDYSPCPEERYAVIVCGEQVPARFVTKADVGDLALVECDKELPVAPLAAASPKVGERVRHWGFHGHQMTFKEGTMAVLHGTNRTDGVYGNAPIISSTVNLEDGDSGTGAINDAGELCAVAHEQPAGYGCDYCSIDLVHDLLKKYDRLARK